jgi:hypothetical protein
MGIISRLKLGRTSCIFLLFNVAYLVKSCTDFKQIHGERFVGPVVAMVTTVGLQQCVRECLSRPAVCGGVNYRKTQLLCEIVTSTDRTVPSPECIRIGLNDVSISCFPLTFLLSRMQIF